VDLNDFKIKRIIATYFETNDSIYINEFRREVELYIYYFPKLAYRKSDDFCGDFYLYVIERINTIIKNFPLEADIKFKTWFNYVLKNQYINFCNFQKKENKVEFDLEDYSESIPITVYEDSYENFNYNILKEGIKKLDSIDQLLIKFYYFPEYLNENDIINASNYFQLPIKDVLNIQKNLIQALNLEIDKIRNISYKLNDLSKKILEMKYKLFIKEGGNPYDDSYFKEKNENLMKLAKLENRKNRLIRELDSTDRITFIEFSRLFKNNIRARIKLQEAKRKLKFEILKLMKLNNN